MRFNTNMLFILTILYSLISCKGEVKEKEVVLRPVKYMVVNTSSAESVRSFSGVAKAGDEIELSFRSNGIITELNAKVGQKIKKGELIAKLDNVQAKLAYEQAVSSLNSANSEMKTAKSNLDRVKSMFEKGSNSLSEYEAAKNSYQSSLDSYESAKRNKSIQQSQINYGYIKAPKSGVIAEKNKQLNENVNAGEVIAVLNAGKNINVIVGLPENVINKVTLGMKTKLLFSAIENKDFEGSVIEISPIIDMNSATYMVKIDITKPIEAIKPGMAANTIFDFSNEVKEDDDSLIIPLKSVGEDGSGKFVFIINSKDNKTGQVKKQVIQVGKLSTAGIEVLKGLNEGDRIATAGLQTLLDGQNVSLQQN